MSFLKNFIAGKNSETIKIIVKVILFIFRRIFKDNCNGNNKKG